MIKFIRTDSGSTDFIALIKLLDQELAIIDGKDHNFYSQYNKIDMIKHVVVAYEEELPVSCGAMKAYNEDTMEIKRMYTVESFRGKGLGGKVLGELEVWAGESGYKNCVLETGKKQADAVHLYTKSGYVLTPNYGQYIGVDNSVCFIKVIGK